MKILGLTRFLHRLILVCIFSVAPVLAKDPPQQVIVWLPNGPSLLRFTFGKFKQVGSYSGQHNYVIDTVVENLWSRPFQNAGFRFMYLTKIR